KHISPGENLRETSALVHLFLLFTNLLPMRFCYTSLVQVALVCSHSRGGFTTMIYVFEDYELDTQLRALRRSGQEISLEPKMFEVLLYLVRHHDTVVLKSDLLAAVWPEVLVQPHAVERCINLVRTALGDNGREQRFIKTIPKVGYRFVAPVAGALDV